MGGGVGYVGAFDVDTLFLLSSRTPNMHTRTHPLVSHARSTVISSVSHNQLTHLSMACLHPAGSVLNAQVVSKLASALPDGDLPGNGMVRRRTNSSSHACAYFRSCGTAHCGDTCFASHSLMTMCCHVLANLLTDRPHVIAWCTLPSTTHPAVLLRRVRSTHD